MHILRALAWKKENLKRVDIYIFSSFQGSEEIYNRLVEVKKCRNVYYIKKEEYSAKTSVDVIYRLIRRGKLRKLLKKVKYDKIYFFNSTYVLNTLVFTLASKNNPNLELNYVEDCPTLFDNEFYEWDWNWKMKLIFPLIGMKNPAQFIHNYWFSAPEYMNYKGRAKVCKLPKISRKDKSLKNLINQVFEYNPIGIENMDLIIMEESFFQDQRLLGNEDYIIFNEIRERFPKKNIVLKLHPRTEKDRFSSKFCVIGKQNIPWEVILLNNDCSNICILSISCTTMVSGNLLFGDEPYIVYLYPLFKNIICTGKELYFNDALEKNLEKILELYHRKEKIKIIHKEEELFNYLENLWKET